MFLLVTPVTTNVLFWCIFATPGSSDTFTFLLYLDAVEKLDLSVSDKMFCSYCNWTFTDREEQMSHYKTDWHRFNLKQKLRNARHVSVEEFEEMTGDAFTCLTHENIKR